jgi:hypothetical protein
MKESFQRGKKTMRRSSSIVTYRVVLLKKNKEEIQRKEVSLTVYPHPKAIM